MVQSVSNILSGQLRSSTDENKTASMSALHHPQHYLKLCVLGAHGVGKSAVIVRYLTRRFIGEYRSQVDITYHHVVTLQNQRAFIEICDFSPKYGQELQVEEVWGNCHLIVFSIADYKSFLTAVRIARSLQRQSQLNAYPQMTLLGNKMDLEHSRQVSTEEAVKAAEVIPCKYAEVSAAESREDIVPIIHDLVLRSIYQLEGERSSSCTLPASLHPSVFYANEKSTTSDIKVDNINSRGPHLPICNTSTSSTLPRDLLYSSNTNKLPKNLYRSFSCRQNHHKDDRFQEMWLEQHSSKASRNERKIVNGLIKSKPKFSSNEDDHTARNNSSRGRFLNSYKYAINLEVNDKKIPKSDSNSLSSVFLRGRSNTLNGFGKNIKRPLELRPSVDVFQDEKRNAKNRKPNSRFFTLVNSFGNSEPKQSSLFNDSRTHLDNSNLTTCITRMVVQADEIGPSGLPKEVKPPPYKGKADRSFLPTTEEKPSAQSNSKRKFGVFGISSFGSVFSKGSLPDLPKATASLYTKIGSIKNTIKKRSV